MTTKTEETPYILQSVTTVEKRYNPQYGDTRVCDCGHLYERHFDGWEDMCACGCKYCQCDEFVEIVDPAGFDVWLVQFVNVAEQRYLRPVLIHRFCTDRRKELHQHYLAGVKPSDAIAEEDMI